MVYCGKPSRACVQCKERKVKCDLKESCRPCRRADLKCSGLRDPKLLVFRDESTAVVQKATKHQSSKKPPKPLSIPLEDRARGFFFQHYVLGKTRTFDYIQSFPPETDSRLCASLAAVSLAHFSIKARSSEAMKMARLKYICALRLTNEALQTGELATKDATFLSILLLDLFEKITKRTPETFESWTKHIHGALAIARLRGVEQFNNPVGLRMFMQLSSTVLIACVQRDVPLPADFLALYVEWKKYLNLTEPKARLSQCIIRFIDLRVAIKNRSLLSSEVVYIAKDVDTDFDLIAKTMPPDFQYSIIPFPSNSDEVFGNHFLFYPHRRVTHLSNLLRIMRVLLNEIITQNCLEILETEDSRVVIEEYQAEITHSSSVIASMATEICASVPQYTLLPRFSPFQSTSEPDLDPTYFRLSNNLTTTSSNPGHVTPPTSMASTFSISSTPKPCFWSELHNPFQTSRCYSLIYPLYVAAQSLASPEPLRRWVINRLYVMSTDMGIREASLVAGILERREKRNPWIVYAMIGSYSFSA